MTTTLVSATSDVNQIVSGPAGFYGWYHAGEARLLSVNGDTNASYITGIRFPVTPTDMPNLRDVRLQLAPYVNRNNLNFEIRGHLSTNSGPWTTDSRPYVRYNTAATQTFLNVIVPDAPQNLTMEIPDPEKKMLAMVQEMLAVPGRVPGSPLTFLLRASYTRDYDCRLFGSTDESLIPRLFFTYGVINPDAMKFQQTDIGDSMAAYLCHDGFEVASLPVIFMGSTTVGKAAAGMKNTSGIINMYGGDNFRGYETPGTIEAIYKETWGEEEFDVVRKQHAIAGSTLGQWFGDLENLSTGKWGGLNAPTSTRYDLANPEHTWQLVWMSLAGNDMHKRGGGARLISEEDDDALADQQWNDYIGEFLDPWLRGCLEEVYNTVNDPFHTWCMLPGYPNFCVIKSLNTNAQILPASGSRLSNAQDTFRAVYSLNISIGGCQFLYDNIGYSGTGEIHPPWQDIQAQSALVRAAAAWQRANRPGDIPAGYYYWPNGDWWQYGMTQVGFPTLGPLSYAFWVYAGINRWYESYRNVTDVNVNRRFRMLDDLYTSIVADYPQAVFIPSPQSMGIDNVYSADASSPFAQSDPLDWVEGIHPNKDGMRKWITNAGPQGQKSTLRRMMWNFPFMQKFSNDIYGQWDGVTLRRPKLAGIYDGTLDTKPGVYIHWPATRGEGVAVP